MARWLLIVEDDEDVREGLAAFAEQEGYEVEVAPDGKAALDKMKARGAPSLVILDLMMPVMDGWTLRSTLLEDERFAHVPVVLLSGVGDLQRRCQMLEAVDYLQKPVDLHKLRTLIQVHC